MQFHSVLLLLLLLLFVSVRGVIFVGLPSSGHIPFETRIALSAHAVSFSSFSSFSFFLSFPFHLTHSQSIVPFPRAQRRGERERDDAENKDDDMAYSTAAVRRGRRSFSFTCTFFFFLSLVQHPALMP